MKTYTLIVLILTLNMAGYGRTTNGTDSVAMGQYYANDIYFSFSDGVVASVSRTNWDIGFHTTVWTAAIITNGGAGVQLYTYPDADTAGWSTVDTAGILSWPMMVDSENDWEEGAFARHATGHPDYGWGKYNPITHDVVGDSVYILKTLDGTYKKIWILRKNSSNNTYFIRLANLDGSDDHVVELNINPYRNVNFIYYAFASGELIEREPDTASWDILFTKYMAIQDDGTLYPVVGVLNNFKTYSNKFEKIGPDFSDWTSQPLDSTKSPIGWNWKTYDMNIPAWTIADSTAFFTNTRERSVYKLVFNKFEGSSTGKIVFDHALVSPSGVSEPNNEMPLRVYPNPVKDHLNLDFGGGIKGDAGITIFDITGKQVYASRVEAGHGILTIQVPESSISDGLHVINVISEKGSYSSKFLVTK